MSGPGRPKKPNSEKLVCYGIRIRPQYRENAMSYPMSHPLREKVRQMVEDAYIKPYTDNIIGDGK